MNMINKLEGLSPASLSNPLVRLLSTQVKITLRYDLGYMHKKWTILERLSRNKHSSLFDLFVSCKEKGFKTSAPEEDIPRQQKFCADSCSQSFKYSSWGESYKTFKFVIY